MRALEARFSIYKNNAAERDGSGRKRSSVDLFRGHPRPKKCSRLQKSLKSLKNRGCESSRGQIRHLREKCCRTRWFLMQTELCGSVSWHQFKLIAKMQKNRKIASWDPLGPSAVSWPRTCLAAQNVKCNTLQHLTATDHFCCCALGFGRDARPQRSCNTLPPFPVSHTMAWH